MSVVAVSGLHKSFGAHAVLTDVSFQLARGDRAGLVGRNGAGKTTLLDVLAGRAPADAGHVAIARATRVGYLTQDPELPEDLTVRAAALSAFEHLASLEAELARLGAALAEAGTASADRLAAYGDLQTRFEHAGGYEREHRAEQTLAGLGLPPAQWTSPVRRLSGGQRVRLALCRLLLQEPAVLLADEPTNHLDAQAVEWLEERLARWSGALLLVSHDRYFLDRVCTRTLELDGSALTAYSGGYTSYVRQREEAVVRAATVRARSQEEAERLAAYVERYRAGNRARQAKSRERRLERLRAEGPAAGPGPSAPGPRLRFEPRSATGREVLSVEGLAKAYGPRVLFAPWDALVFRGERVGVVGPNGAGKTTLLRLLAGEEAADAGGAYWGRGVEVSWFRQDLGGIDDEAGVLDNVLASRDDLGAPEARTILARFDFRGDAVFARAGDLSGGERNRLLLCLLSLEQGNVLLCDEPTNHLDIPGREALEHALAEFPGTLFVVSHDRYLLRRLCTRIWWLKDGLARDLEGGFAAWEAERTRAEPEAPPAEPAPVPRDRRQDREERRRQAEVAALEERVAATEAEVRAAGERLTAPELYRDGRAAAEAVTAYEAARARLEALYAEWERAADRGPGQDSPPGGRS